MICRTLDARQTRILDPQEVNQNTQRDLASLAGCIYREKSVESSSVTADPSAIGQIGRRPAHLHGTRANDSKGALAIAHGRLARYTQILHNADHVFVERLAAEFNAAALAIERAGHELNLLSRGEADVRRKFYGRSSLNGGGQLVGGSNRYGLTGLCNACIARLLAFSAVFGVLCLGNISLVLPKRSCERTILANHGVGGNYRIKDRLMRWKTTSRLITHVCPNKQRRTGMRENDERERAIENNPHGFWHRFGRATRWRSKDGNSKGSDFGIRPNHTQRLFSRQISSKRWHLQKAEAHTLPKSLEQ